MIRAVGIDAAFANMGLVAVDLDILRPVEELQCRAVRLINTERQNKKVVRKSSDDLRRAIELHEGLLAFCQEFMPRLAFVEVPTGSLSATAARSLGIAVGVLASCPVPIIEVQPMEVKRAVLPGCDRKGPSKKEIIAWAVKRWPDAGWKRVSGRITNDNEHAADALAAVIAGLKTPEFQQLMALTENEITRTVDSRPASNSRPRPRVPLELIQVVGRPVRR